MKKRILLLAAITTLSLAAPAIVPRQANALSGSDFNAGRIIDDAVFFSPGAMSAQEIQNFLNAKVVTCDTNGTQSTSQWNGSRYYTRAEWGAMNGNPAPFTCLKDYSQAIPNKAADTYCSRAIAGGTKSAAQIIYDVSQACGMNPKAMLVLLQKEQSLVTDDWPWNIQYRSATGYGCPDTAPCDSEYYGFFNQVYNAARQYQRYAKQSDLFNFRPRQNNYVQYNPNAACGGSTVYIENQATAGLYNYTPYQPNQAARNNLYGTGDNCSAYGNRNFWRMFNDWFGPTYGPAFAAQYHSQSPYPIIDTGSAISAYFQFKNIGTAFWKDDFSIFPGYRPVHMANTAPINRPSSFMSNNWLAASRPTGSFTRVYESDGTTPAPDQHTVQPGQIARFEFTIQANPGIPGGVYREHFQPIVEGAPNGLWHMGTWAYLDIGVNHPSYKAAYHSQSAYPTISRGSSGDAHLQFKNTGSSPWFDDTSIIPGKQPIHLATSWPINRASTFSATWPSPSRPNLNFTRVYESDGTTLASNQHIVQPGQIARFEFKFSVPASTAPGFYSEHFQPIAESAPGQTWNLGSSAWLGITVTD